MSKSHLITGQISAGPSFGSEKETSGPFLEVKKKICFYDSACEFRAYDVSTWTGADYRLLYAFMASRSARLLRNWCRGKYAGGSLAGESQPGVPGKD
jgi:hypothetical protein